VLLVFGVPCQLRLLAEQEHGRTIQLAVIGQHVPVTRAALFRRLIRSLIAAFLADLLVDALRRPPHVFAVQGLSL